MSVEPSAEWKSWYRTYFTNLRALESFVDASKFEPDTKALAIYVKPSYALLGKLSRKNCQFEWEGSAAETLGTTVNALQAAAL